MKELSIEEKARAYNEAFDRVKELLSRCTGNMSRRTKVYRIEDIESIFPELKKSEDEKIKEDLIEWFSDFPDMIWSGHYKKDVIAWLEKQGDTNETINKDEFAQCVLKGAAINLITWIDYNATEGNMCLSNMECKDVEDALVSGDWNKIYAYIKKKLEKQYEYNPYSGTSFKYNGHIWGMCARDGGVEILVDGEIKERVFLDNKPQDKYAQEATKEEKVDNQNCVNFADDVKLKFKVGDWVVFDNGNVEHITSVGTHGYTFDDGDYLLHDECDKIAHLWSIQDAKDGDVLFMDNGLANCIFIYKSSKNGIISKYASYNNFGFEGDHYLVLNDGYVIPATKEQRDTLFAKMKKAGYAFDFEKKELKKLGQPEVTKTSDQEEITEIPFGAKDSELQEATYFIPKGFHAEIDDDKVVIKKGEKPAEWSEDDERIKKRLINLVNEIYNNTNYITFLEHKELLAWLEKLDDNVEL